MNCTAVRDTADSLDATAVDRPTIGVTGPDGGGLAAWLACRFAIWRAGGRAQRVTPSAPAADTALAGLVLTGGADIDPRRYRRAPRDGSDYDPARDTFELDLIERARDRDLPLLGICRGMQLINVAHGGALFADIEPRARAHVSPLPLWYVDCVPTGVVRRALDRSRVRINKIHHDAIERLGDGLVDVGWDDDGLIQAIEVKGMAFGVGVQWHPEYLPYLAPHRRLFEALVDAARTPALPATERTPLDSPAIEAAPA